MIFSIAVIISDNRKLVKNPKFEEAILNKIGSRIDTEEILGYGDKVIPFPVYFGDRETQKNYRE